MDDIEREGAVDSSEPMTLDQFMANVTPGSGSRLDAYQVEILTLRDKNYTLKQICNFLRGHGCNVTLATLDAWLKKPQNSGKKGLLRTDKQEMVRKEESQDYPETKRPAGISDAAWNEMQVKALKRNRK